MTMMKRDDEDQQHRAKRKTQNPTKDVNIEQPEKLRMMCEGICRAAQTFPRGAYGGGLLRDPSRSLSGGRQHAVLIGMIRTNEHKYPRAVATKVGSRAPRKGELSVCRDARPTDECQIVNEHQYQLRTSPSICRRGLSKPQLAARPAQKKRQAKGRANRRWKSTASSYARRPCRHVGSQMLRVPVSINEGFSGFGGASRHWNRNHIVSKLETEYWLGATGETKCRVAVTQRRTGKLIPLLATRPPDRANVTRGSLGSCRSASMMPRPIQTSVRRPGRQESSWGVDVRLNTAWRSSSETCLTAMSYVEV